MRGKLRQEASRPLTPIGFLESCYRTRFGIPRQSLLVRSSSAILHLNLNASLNGAVEGLEQWSHLWIIFLFHLNTNRSLRAKVHPPRLEGKKLGVFATRSPHRPNPIGLSVVKLDRVEQNRLYLSGIDMADGTPVLDIKPYVPEIDQVAQASGLTFQRPLLEVTFTPAAEEKLKQIKFELRPLIIETIALDPRPQLYRQGKYLNQRTEHAIYLKDWDIHFSVFGLLAEVEQIYDCNRFK